MAFTVTMNADVSPSARPIYHSPEVGGIARPRQGSMRKSSYTTPLPPGVESERTAIPAERDRETDTFNINPKFLAGWLPTQDLWAQLPSNLQDAIRHVQKTGASVLSGKAQFPSISQFLTNIFRV